MDGGLELPLVENRCEYLSYDTLAGVLPRYLLRILLTSLLINLEQSVNNASAW